MDKIAWCREIRDRFNHKIENEKDDMCKRLERVKVHDIIEYHSYELGFMYNAELALSDFIYDGLEYLISDEACRYIDWEHSTYSELKLIHTDSNGIVKVRNTINGIYKILDCENLINTLFNMWIAAKSNNVEIKFRKYISDFFIQCNQ